MKRLLLFSILSLSLFTPKANAIVIGGCLFPLTTVKTVMAATLVAHGAYEGGKAIFMKLLSTYKAEEAKGN